MFPSSSPSSNNVTTLYSYFIEEGALLVKSLERVWYHWSRVNRTDNKSRPSEVEKESNKSKMSLNQHNFLAHNSNNT